MNFKWMVVPFLMSLTGCGVHTGVHALDNITGATQTCKADFKVDNFATRKLTMTGTFHEGIMEAHCRGGYTDGKREVEPGKSADLHLELTCQECSGSYLRRFLKVEDMNGNEIALKDGVDHVTCSDTSCAAVP